MHLKVLYYPYGYCKSPGLPLINFDPEILRSGISTVFGRSSCFFGCHSESQYIGRGQKMQYRGGREEVPLREVKAIVQKPL
jgi:hypothetical protein